MDGDGTKHPVAVVGVRHDVVVVADDVFHDCQCCDCSCTRSAIAVLLSMCHDCHCHCHSRITFRLLLLPLWSSGCTWREGRVGNALDRGRVDIVDAAKGLLSETNTH